MLFRANLLFLPNRKKTPFSFKKLEILVKKAIPRKFFRFKGIKKCCSPGVRILYRKIVQLATSSNKIRTWPEDGFSPFQK